MANANAISSGIWAKIIEDPPTLSTNSKLDRYERDGLAFRYIVYKLANVLNLALDSEPLSFSEFSNCPICCYINECLRTC